MKTKFGAIVQARMSSERFPGKVLYDVNGKPMLLYLLERLRKCVSLDTIVVATSVEHEDTAIAELCLQLDISCYRGQLSDVASRFIESSEIYNLDAFVRVNGDSPLLDQSLIEKSIKIYLSGDYDLVTNRMPRSYPKGQTIEVLRTETYRQTYPLFKEDDDWEHVTHYYYTHPENFRIHNFSYTESLDHVRLCVDTYEDMDGFGAIISRMDRPHWEYNLEDVLRIYHSIRQ
ncbi:cytidylyltransferase domain-containing protein [Chloroflexota bacterium]